MRLARKSWARALRLSVAATLIAVAPALAQSDDAATPVQPAPSEADAGKPIELRPGVEPTLQLSATLAEDGEPITFGLVWRVYSAKPNQAGQYPLIVKSEDARPSIRLTPGSYIVHAAYGRAQATRSVALIDSDVSETFNLDAGGLRIWADLGRGARSSVEDVTFSIYSSEQDDYGDRKFIAETNDVGKLIRLTAGTYHIVSHYGDANAIVRADVKVEAGKITDATVMHRAANVTLKLVTESGGEALANTQWNVLTPGGDTVTETIGAFPTYVLAEGEYEAIARHDDEIYNKTFNVEAGIDREVELLAE